MAFAGQIVIRIGAQISGLLKGLESSEKAIAKTGRNLERIGKRLSVAVTLPLAGLGVIATKSFATFDQAMTRSLAILSNVSDRMRTEMENAAKEVGRTTTFSATQAAQAYFFLASAGLDAAQSIAALPKVVQFAQAGAFDLSTATDLLTDAQSALGLTIKNDVAKNMQNMVRVSDVLVRANTVANASTQQFSESLTNKLGARLRILGKDIEEGAAVLAVFADQGEKGAGAGEKAAIVFRDLERAAFENASAFKKFNIEVFDTAGEVRNIADVIEDLEGVLSGVSDETRRAILAQLGFQERSVAATLSLIGFSDALRGYERQFDEAGGTTERVANKQVKNFGDLLTILKNRLGVVSEKLGENIVELLGLEKAFNGVASAIEGLIDKFNSLSPGVRRLTIVTGILVAAIPPLLIVLGVFLQILPKLRTAISAVGASLTFLVKNPIAIAIAGFAALVVVSGGFVNALKRMAFSILGIPVLAVEYLSELLLKLGAEDIPFLGEAINRINVIFREGVQDLAFALNKLEKGPEGFSDAFKKLVTDVKQGSRDIANAVRNAGNAIDDAADALAGSRPGPKELGVEFELQFNIDDATRRAELFNSDLIQLEGTVKALQIALDAASDEFNIFNPEQARLLRDWQQQLQAAQSSLVELQFGLDLKKIEEFGKVFGASADTVQLKSEAARRAIEELIVLGFDASSEAIQRLSTYLVNNADSWAVWSATVIDTVTEVRNITYDAFQSIAQGVGQAIASFVVFQQSLSKTLLNVVRNAVAQAISAIIQLILNLIFHQNKASQAAAQAAGDTVGARAAEGYANTLAGHIEADPLFGLIHGIPAAAAASAAIIGGAKVAQLAGRGVFLAAEGLLAFGSILSVVGEASSSSNPEVVAPLDKLRSFIQPAGVSEIRLVNEMDGERVAEMVIDPVTRIIKREL